MATERSKDPPPRRKLFVTACSSVYTGHNTRGDTFTIYEITANREDGQPVEQKLRSFEDLPLGELLEFTITKFLSEKYGDSYTLARTNRPNSQQRFNDLKQEIDDLKTRLGIIEAQIAGDSSKDQADLDARFAV